MLLSYPTHLHDAMLCPTYTAVLVPDMLGSKRACSLAPLPRSPHYRGVIRSHRKRQRPHAAADHPRGSPDADRDERRPAIAPPLHSWFVRAENSRAQGQKHRERTQALSAHYVLEYGDRECVAGNGIHGENSILDEVVVATSGGGMTHV